MIMKINKIIENVKDNIIYFLLIAVYFFFVNIEARKELKYKNTNNKDDQQLLEKKSSIKNDSKISIPVIPFEN